MTDDEKENWLNQDQVYQKKKTFNETRETREVAIKQIQELKERERGKNKMCPACSFSVLSSLWIANT